MSEERIVVDSCEKCKNYLAELKKRIEALEGHMEYVLTEGLYPDD